MLLDIRKHYVITVLPYAESLRNQLGIQVDCVILHAAHESNWGQSQLTRMAHNHFGATPGEAWEKAKREELPMSSVSPWTSLDEGHATIGLPTTEYVKGVPPEKIRFFCFPGDITDKKADGKGGAIVRVDRAFRQYATDLECFKDYGDRLSLPRYDRALDAARKGSVGEFCRAIGVAGYGTDPHYSQSLNNLYAVLEETQWALKSV
jgi:flagellum-specific peptidoglycan hydrolase FlgJ